MYTIWVGLPHSPTCFIFFLSFVRCTVISKHPVGATQTYNCKGMEGRYINIKASGYHHLMLCEVEVTGQPAENGDLNNAFLFTLLLQCYVDFST